MNTRRLGYALVIGGGLYFLLQLFGWNFGATLWPFFIFVPGLALLAAASSDHERSGLFIPGSVLTTLGLIFFVQSATDHFESWAYAWTLLWAAVGAGMLLQGERGGNPELAGQGRRLLSLAGAGFAIGFVFFEGFVFGDLQDTWLFHTGVPLLLIVAGGYLLYRQSSEPKA
jgi:hypothetical protein